MADLGIILENVQNLYIKRVWLLQVQGVTILVLAGIVGKFDISQFAIIHCINYKLWKLLLRAIRTWVFFKHGGNTWKIESKKRKRKS